MSSEKINPPTSTDKLEAAARRAVRTIGELHARLRERDSEIATLRDKLQKSEYACNFLRSRVRTFCNELDEMRNEVNKLTEKGG